MNKCNQLITIKEAATILSMKESRIRWEIFKKRIPYLKIGRSIRFSEEDLVNWFKSKKAGGI